MTLPAEKPLILLVEDDHGLAELVREEVLLHGWDYLHAATGRQALEILSAQRPDLVLLDFSLPDMTASQLLDQAELPPFIVTTGSGDERIAVEMMKKGALDYLVKDIHFLGALPGAVERALHTIGMERKLAETQARLRAADEYLRNAQKMESLGRMAGGIAHDFNNLFQALQGNLESSLRKLPAGGAGRTDLERALKVLGKATSLAHRMLDFSGKGFRRAEVLDLNHMLDECLATLRELPGAADLRVVPGADLPPVSVDPDQLCQVLTGLVANAREALGADGTPIVISTGIVDPLAGDAKDGAWIQPAATAGPMVCVTIEDKGAGMTKEVLERAFDPFFSTHRPGRGLGLSAALGILKAHGAGLWVRTAPGQGTTIRLLFPPAADQAPEPEPATVAVAGGAGHLALMLVDDDEDLQETLGEFLREGLGYRVFQARDGVEAVDVFRKEQGGIGLILMDATMPRMTGPDAFKIIREMDPGARAILCSGFSEEAGARVAREAGFLEFLKKPFSLRTLQEHIVRVMGTPSEGLGKP